MTTTDRIATTDDMAPRAALPPTGLFTTVLVRPLLAGFAAALLAGACSADIKRFEGFELGGDTTTRTGSVTPAVGVGSALGDASPVAGAQRAGRAPAAVGSVEREELPVERHAALDTPVPPSPRQAVSDATPVVAASGETITVAPGDTLYGLSRRHGVALAELMAVNGLDKPDLRPGQKLQLPAGSAVRPPPDHTPYPAEQEATTAEAPDDWTGTHTIAAGDSLYKLARRYGTRSADLQRYNGIKEPTRLRLGQVLRVPGGGTPSGGTPSGGAPAGGAVAATAPAATTVVAAADEPARGVRTIDIVPPSAPVATAEAPATIAPKEPAVTQVRADKPTLPSPVAEAAAKSDKLRWPARGRIIAGFGPKKDGTRNDGINLAVPMGSEVHAAADGIVAYAGSELQGYGNLVLVRHDNGWVTAYAHASEVLVKRGDTIKRGQVIAKAGKSGDVDQPQVHFELRQGSDPVDPLPHLEAL
ncbi:MAG: peptidoglycan DD-metalloendopeptidase family protein [Hyphomicrobiaceae bacterium]|nr:peptidoglycan DD-metalloendopeptidase family protein [Hyphomicrobiaceae bacterium]